MKKGFKFSRPLAAASAGAIVALGSMIWLHLELNVEITEQRSRAKEYWDSQSMLIAARSMYEDSNLEALRDQVGRFRVRLGAEGTWDLLVGRFGEGWDAEAGPKEDRGDYSLQIGTFRLHSPSLADWPRIVEAVKASEAIPGVGIEEFEMKTSGSREHRSLDLVRILVAVQARRNATSQPLAP